MTGFNNREGSPGTPGRRGSRGDGPLQAEVLVAAEIVSGYPVAGKGGQTWVLRRATVELVWRTLGRYYITRVVSLSGYVYQARLTRSRRLVERHWESILGMPMRFGYARALDEIERRTMDRDPGEDGGSLGSYGRGRQ